MEHTHKRSLAPLDNLDDLTFPAASAVPPLRLSFAPRSGDNRLLLPSDDTSDDVAIEGSPCLGSLDEHIVILFISFRDDEDKTVPAHVDLTGHFLEFPLSTLPGTEPLVAVLFQGLSSFTGATLAFVAFLHL